MAQQVTMTLDLVESCIVMKVKDDGRGFDVSQKRSGIGITNMMTRAGSLNGKLSIKSTDRLGTELMVKIPLEL
jgi:signal transduction histidine kinase